MTSMPIRIILLPVDNFIRKVSFVFLYLLFISFPFFLPYLVLSFLSLVQFR